MTQGNTRLDNIFYESHPTGGVPGLNTITYSLWYDPSTGNYEAKQTGVAGFAILPATLLSNGSFTSDAVRDPLLFTDNDVNKPTQTAKDLLIRAKNDVYAAYGHFGGANKGNKINSSALPANINVFLVNNAAVGTSPGISSIFGSSLSAPPGQGNILDNPNPDDYGTKDMAKLFEDYNGKLKYPIDLIEKHQDTLRITQYQYQAPYRDVFEGKQNGSIFMEGAQRQSALKKYIATVTLPIPNNVADSNAVNWGNGDEMNTLAMGVAGNIGAVGGAVAIGKITKAIAKAKGATALGDLLGSKEAAQAAALGITGGLINPTSKAASFSKLLKAAGFEISPETILSRGYGVVANSNLELLFSGPMLRSFQFGYVFSPRSKEEAKMCRKIIRFFKQGMAAKKSNKTTGFGAASFLLSTPNVFKLEYKTDGDKDIAGLNKFKICALSNIQTSYADGQWSAYEGGQPVRTQMILTFKELEPVYESDYQDTRSPSFTLNKEGYQDQPSVGPDEIGF